MEINQEVQRLGLVPMFSKMETSKLKLLSFTSKLLTYKDKEVIFYVNDPADNVYLVMQGEVEILLDNGDSAGIVRGENALIGEMAVISKQGRSVTVRAKGEAILLCIENDVFLQLLTTNPEVSLDVMKQLSDKLAEAHHDNEKLQQQLEQQAW